MAGKGQDRKTATVTMNGCSAFANRSFEAKHVDGCMAPFPAFRVTILECDRPPAWAGRTAIGQACTGRLRISQTSGTATAAVRASR
jgi:hypothetical protein